MSDDRLPAASRALGLVFVVLCGATLVVESLADGLRGRGVLVVHVALVGLFIATLRAPRSAAELRWFVLCGAVARVVLTFVTPFTSHDVHRYLFDGAAFASGVDPWSTLPTAAAVGPLRAEYFLHPEQLAYVGVYPPLATGVLALLSTVGSGAALLAWKVCVTAASLVALRLGVRLAERLNRRRAALAIALHPLLVLEGGLGAHLDTLVVAALAIATWSVASFEALAPGARNIRATPSLRGDPFVAASAFAAAALLKIWPVVAMAGLVPPKRVAGRHIALPIAIGTGAIIVGAYGALTLADYHPLGSLFEMAVHWRFGSPLAALVESFAPQAEGIYRLVAAAGTFGAIVILVHRRGTELNTRLDTTAWVCALPLIVGPVAFPWYALPAAWFAALAQNARLTVWSLCLPLSYEVLDRFDATGVWVPATWPLVVFALVLLAPQRVTRRVIFVDPT